MIDKEIVEYIKDSDDDNLTSLIVDFFDFENRVVAVSPTELDYLENLKATIEQLIDDVKVLGVENVSN